MKNAVVSKRDDGYLLLIAAIVQQAIKDYRIEYFKSMKRGKDTKKFKEVREFFTSDWGQYLCAGNGEKVLRDLEEECKARYTYSWDKRETCITYKGKTLTISEWAKTLGIRPRTLYARLNEKGWTVEEALTIPPGGSRFGKR